MAIVVAVLLVGIIGLLAVVCVGLLLVGTASSHYSRAVAIAEANRAVAEELRAKGEAIQAVVQEERAKTTPRIQRSSVAATPDPRLNLDVQLDQEGNASIDGEEIDLDELRARLAKLKDETSNAFSVRINADPECLFIHVISVMDVCKEVGDIEFRVALSLSQAE